MLKEGEGFGYEQIAHPTGLTLGAVYLLLASPKLSAFAISCVPSSPLYKASSVSQRQ